MRCILCPTPMDITSFMSACVFPITQSDASALLRQIASMIEYNDVFTVFFPDEYQQSCALMEQGREPLFPFYNEAHTPHEERFLEYVHTHLFPLGDLKEYLEEEASTTCRWDTIPLASLGFDDLYDENLEYELFNTMSLGWHLLLYLVDIIDDDLFFEGMFGEAGVSLFALKIESGFVDGEVLTEECKRLQSPLAFFEQALDMVGHCTGTPFLDATSQLPENSIPWTPKSVEIHRDHYQKALQIKQNANLFIHWIEENPVNHFMEVIQFWNHCMRKTHSKKQVEKPPAQMLQAGSPKM